MSQRILVVEDEASMRLPLVDVLKVKGYAVDAVERGDVVVQQVQHSAYDLILLDVMLPGQSGFEVLRELRQKGLDVPVILLTARGQEMDRVLGFELGVDDYVTKPFSLLELLGRIGAVLRRRGAPPSGERAAAPAAGTTVWVGEGSFDLKAFTAHRQGVDMALPAKAFRILEVLLDRAGEVVTRDALMDAVWGQDEAVNERSLNNLMVKLRQVLEPEPSAPTCIIAVHGVGYRLNRGMMKNMTIGWQARADRHGDFR